jgi:hypothetical protein
LDHYKTTLAIVLVVFFNSIALVPAGLWWFFLQHQIVVSFGSNRNAKMMLR